MQRFCVLDNKARGIVMAARAACIRELRALRQVTSGGATAFSRPPHKDRRDRALEVTVLTMVLHDHGPSISASSSKHNRILQQTMKQAPLVIFSISLYLSCCNLCLALTSCPPPQRLRNLLNAPETTASETPILLPCCYDGLTARLVARAGFKATFMNGFGVSASLGHPDTQLVGYAEMQRAATTVSEALSNTARELNIIDPIPCIADADTGYGNPMNVKRTVFGYARAGMAGIMIEDQVAPKRCGHVRGKSVVSFEEAVMRVKAACDARDEYSAQFGEGTGPLVLARTDALVTDGFEAAIQRMLAFREAGCDMTFLEAPESIEQMKEYCDRVDGPKLANMLEYGSTPILPPKELKAMGYTMAAYPLTLLSASINTMQECLGRIYTGATTDDLILSFDETKDVVGFTQYFAEERKYSTS
jgi:2-methylisocitrate lyase-like PEP mutase family enzyme